MSTSAQTTDLKAAVHLSAVNKSFRNGEQVTPVLKHVEFTAYMGEMLLSLDLRAVVRRRYSPCCAAL
ncbi:hypothetical protein [Desulfomonile tiedjei]|uniref:hypothetical protein n=1 Tax=Desulfomonile tiedjei TaxID=2358 RepID=UPI0002DDCC42|nr:hypothetical protein [Desulfomonile tiedjei]